ncbi:MULTISPECIES: fatty acyl-CoA synthetase [Actinomycetes]|uniref:fatty acyl-CoA synthetase n=2 Tax=Actinomycetota TaxID=201174 RepID=UPI0004C09BD5|nr:MULTISPECIES: fatty acyl-CoA synthetase [Actinomycetes]
MPLSDDVTTTRGHSLADIPRRSAARFPHKTAIVHRDTRLSFAAFDVLVDQVAASLWADGLRPGDRMAILSHNCWHYPILVFGAARIGVVSVPINFMLTAPEIAFILNDCAPRALIVEGELCGVADQAVEQSSGAIEVPIVLSLSNIPPPVGWTEFDDWLARSPDTPPPVTVADDDVIRIMYTSGTESRPKGAIHTSRTLMWQYMSCIVTGEMTADDIEVHALPLYHCAQLDNFLITDLYLGATSIILDRPDPTAILDAIEREKATNLFCPPTVWGALLRSPALAGTDLTSLRKGYYGASALPVEMLRELRRLAPELRLWNFYGQTEMASLATVLGPDDQDTRGGSAGRPALNVETQIVDDADRVVESGVVGEIVHRSPQTTVGYHNLPDKTADAFAGGWFHSGDLGYFDDDGYLWVVDRKKDMIKTGGENVASREVEEILYAMDGVQEAAVFGVSDPVWIEAVTAVVVPVAGHTIDELAVLTHCRDHLAPYKIPKSVLFMDQLPKNPSGKILKRVLRNTINVRR